MNLSPECIVCDEQFKNTGAPRVACLAALHTAFTGTVRANFAHQTLCQNPQQGRAEQEGLDAHVGEAGDSACCIVGVQGGQHQVARHGSLNGNLSRFKITNLTNHDDVGVLTKNGAQGFGKGQIDLGIDLGLPHTRQLVLDGVFHRHDVAPHGI